MGQGRKRKAAEDTPLTGVYLIQCSRESELIEEDDDTYVDCYGDEVDNVRQELEDYVTAGDGTWIYDSKSAGNLETSSGQIVTFASKEAANTKAAALWNELLKHHPFDRVYKPAEAGGEESSEGEDESDEEEEGQRSGAAATLKTTPSGCFRFEFTQQYTVDPWSSGTLNNIVKSTLVVQVIQSRVGG